MLLRPIHQLFSRIRTTAEGSIYQQLREYAFEGLRKAVIIGQDRDFAMELRITGAKSRYIKRIRRGSHPADQPAKVSFDLRRQVGSSSLEHQRFQTHADLEKLPAVLLVKGRDVRALLRNFSYKSLILQFLERFSQGWLTYP